MVRSRAIILVTIAGCLLMAANPAAAQRNYGPGVTDGEIKIGNIMPYSGPLSAYALIGRTQDAFFKKLNAEGGINGRKINFISYDDAFSPAKTVEQARKLVESDEVLLIFQSLGTPTNNAIQKYLNEKRVPQLFVATGATKFGDPKNFPWTMGWQPTYQTEGKYTQNTSWSTCRRLRSEFSIRMTIPAATISRVSRTASALRRRSE